MYNVFCTFYAFGRCFHPKILALYIYCAHTHTTHKLGVANVMPYCLSSRNVLLSIHDWLTLVYVTINPVTIKRFDLQVIYQEKYTTEHGQWPFILQIALWTDFMKMVLVSETQRNAGH